MISNYLFYRSSKLSISIAFAWFVFVLLAGSVMAQRPELMIHAVFDGDPMYTVLPPGAIPAIIQPEFLSGKEAATQMLPEEPVIGVIFGGEERAYSMWHLDAHEIVNDTIAKTAIAVTW